MSTVTAEQVYTRFGRRLRDRRRARGMTQKQLGDLIGLSRASIVNIEHGRHHVLLHHVVAMADALKVSLLELLQPIQSSNSERTEFLHKRLDRSLAEVVERLLQGSSK